MKVRIVSWFLAGAYLGCGVLLFLFVQRCQGIFSGFNIQRPFLTRTILAAGPFGCLSFSVAVGVAVVLKDFRFRSSYLNPIFALVLVVWIVGVFWALFCSLSEAGGLRITYDLQ